MIFTKEIIKSAGLLHINNLPTMNVLDASSVCDGKLTKDFYKVIVDYFTRLEMSIYVVYVPLSRIHDHNDWNPIKIQGCSCCGNDMRLEILDTKQQQEIWIENKEDYNYWFPRIIPCKELEGEECDQIWCYVIGIKNIDDYKNKEILSFNEAKEVFGEDGVNWCHVKIG